MVGTDENDAELGKGSNRIHVQTKPRLRGPVAISHEYKPQTWLKVAASVGRGDLSPSQGWTGLRVLHTARKNHRFLASLGRSGSHYLFALLTCAADIDQGFDGDYRYEDFRWVHRNKLWHYPRNRLFWRGMQENYSFNENSFFWDHFPPNPTPDLVDLSSAKAIFTVRNIADSLASWLEHLDDTESQNLQAHRRFIDGLIEYFNFWGDHVSDKTPGKDYRCIRYEELTVNPMDEILGIKDFWSLNLSESSLRKSVEICSAEKMRAKIPSGMEESKSNLRISAGGGRKRALPDETTAYLRGAISGDLRHGFGYSY